MKTKFIVSLLLVVIYLPVQASSSAPASANTYIVSPAHGETVSSPVTVIFGLQGMGVAPAGTAKNNTGHHHLIINSPTPSLSKAIPKDKNHKHFGGGQTQVTLDLAPGTHTLQLVLGDKSHIPHNPPVVSEKITINVK